MKKVLLLFLALITLVFMGCELENEFENENRNNPPTVKSFTVNGVSFGMVKVEGGTFTMGATPEQVADANDYEKPPHAVTLDDYAIGETEVTQALWQAVMGTNPSYYSYEVNNLPVESISWYDCQVFILKLNQLTGKTFRLPTEAEWEFAARGGKQSNGYKYSGSNNISEVAWCTGYGNDFTMPVDFRIPNELGIYSMSGNVSEWCEDLYGEYPSSPQTNPQGPSTGSNRVVRGGSKYVEDCRVSSRKSFPPAQKDRFVGFRLCL